MLLLVGWTPTVFAEASGASPVPSFAGHEITLDSRFNSYDILQSISCLTSTSCVAVGTDGNGQPLVISGDPATWTSANAIEVTLGSGDGGFGFLYSVSCTSINWCVAVGNDGNNQPLVIAGNPATWSSANATELSLVSTFGTYGYLYGVWCGSATSCVAAGNDLQGHLLFVTGDPASWTSASAREIALTSVFGHHGYLSAITCSSITWCVAVGDDAASQPLEISGNPATWTNADARSIWLAPNFDSFGTLNSVSCTSDVSCVAAGRDGYQQPLILSGNPATWSSDSATELTLGAAFASGGSIQGITCSTSTSCVAVGSDSAHQPLFFTGDPSSWSGASAQEATLGSSFGSAGGVSGVTCTSVTSCVAVGEDGNFEPLVLGPLGAPLHVATTYLNGALSASWEAVTWATSYTCTLLYGYDNPSTFTVVSATPSCTFAGTGSPNFGVSVVANFGGEHSAASTAFPVSVKTPSTTPKAHTITCQKGTTSHKKKVTGIHPGCPSGWHRI